jgi:protein-S-isoprenylcysteine O-methyltransferase Ste14
MHISKYQKLFGVGPLNLLICIVLICVLWIFDRALGHVKIMGMPDAVRMFGLALIVIWIIWHAWCVKTISGWWRNNELCTTGPYRVVRHPLYSGSLILGLTGISLLFNSWILLLAPILEYGILSRLVRKEEAMMASVFGDTYREYAMHTGRLLPKLFR